MHIRELKGLLASIVLLGSMAFVLTACGKKSASDFYNDGVSYMEKQEYALAQESFSQAVSLNPDRAEYYMDYAFALLQDGKAEEALIQFNKGYSDKDNQIVRENNKKILRGKGIAYLSQNEYELAQECLEQALLIEEEKKLNRDILAYLGVAYEKQGDYEKAIETYTTLIEEKKSDASSYASRAEIYGMLGRIEEAAADYDTAIALDGTNFSYYFGKYSLYRERASEDSEAAAKAQEVLSDAYALKTTSPEDYYNLAIIHYLSGNYDVAAAELADALNQGFSDAAFYLGCICRQKGDYEGALSYYSEYAKEREHIGVAAYYEGMADCLIWKGDYSAAFEMVENGLELRDKSSERSLLYREIYLYEKMTEYGTAAKKAEAFLTLYPDDTVMQNELVFLRSRLQ